MGVNIFIIINIVIDIVVVNNFIIKILLFFFINNTLFLSNESHNFIARNKMHLINRDEGRKKIKMEI